MDTNYYFCRKSSASVMMAVFLFLLFLMTGMLPAHVLADPHPGQSKNVVIIGGTTLDCSSSSANRVMNGGCLPVTEPTPPVGLADFTFTAMPSANVNAANLASYDTAVLNVANDDMDCNVDVLTASQKTDLVNFVKDGKKLIIYDSECSTQNYSWLPFPFTTANPGAMGANGTLTILEENILSSKDSTNVHYIDAGYLGQSTDAVGDMNVMTTYNPNWCVDMSGTNANNVTGPVHTYAKLAAAGKEGLIIYNGLDVDYMYPGSSNKGALELQKIWVQELQQPMNPSGLPCGVTAVGITLNPPSATNTTGTSHTVTAEMKDLLGNPTVGTLVTFSVKTGPNASTTGTCSPADCKTDSTGKVSFTYASNGTPGIDEIEACYTNSQQVCSQTVTKEWKEAISTATTTPYTLSGKGGGGSFGLLEVMLGLVATAFAFLVRRQRVAAVAVMGGLAVTAVMMAAPVQAGWYAGVGGGLTRGDFSSSTLEGQLVAKGYNTPPNAITSVSVDNTDSGWKIFGGYQFNRFLAAEVSRVNLGDTKSTVTGSLTTPPSDIPTLLNDAADAHGYLARGWTVAGVGIWPVKPTVSLFAKLGVFRWKADINITEISTGQSVSRDENGSNAMGGIGIKHMPNPKWELRAEIERYKVSSDWVDFLSLGVGYRF